MTLLDTHRTLALVLVTSFLLTVVVSPPPAGAQPAASEACAAALTVAGAFADYRLRDSDTNTLPQGYHRDYSLTFARGNHYVLLACGDGRVHDLDIVLYDENGNEIDRDELRDAQPVVEVSPRWTGPFTARVVMYDTAGGGAPYYTLAVLYRPR